MVPIFESLILYSHCTKRIISKNIWKFNLKTITMTIVIMFCHSYVLNVQILSTNKLKISSTIWLIAFSFKINKLSTTDNIFNGILCDVLYTGCLNKDISFGDIIYFEPKNIQYKKLVNGVIDQLKVSLIDRDGKEILSNFKISIVLHIV